MFSKEEVKQKIKEIHSNDNSQLNIIFDTNKKIIVEAPAGCGKTKTMISKIAYMLATESIESTKKILALTFSVNAAYKIKKDIFEQLPGLTGCTSGDSLKVTDKIYVSNYHGFCRKILQLYGRNLLDNKENIIFSELIPIDDVNQETLHLKYEIDNQTAKFLSDFSIRVKQSDINYIEQHWHTYNKLVKNELISKNLISYNAIILLTCELFEKHQELKKFYKDYFHTIFIDEFQDTNYISWKLIKNVVDKNTTLVLMGDSLQRIYGFIGALPNIIDLALEEYQMKKYEMTTNYRFKDNPDMLILDKNIRLNAQQINNNSICEISNPYIIVTRSQEDEANWISEKILEFKKNNDRVAVLFRTGANNKNTKVILDKLKMNKIAYFFALFTDEDPNYDQFHQICLIEFNKLISDRNAVTYRVLQEFFNRIKKNYKDKENDIIKSLLKLLEIFCNRISEDYSYLKNEELIIFIQDMFINKGLKQNMDKVEENIIVATIHAFKGLEYNYVIIADNEMSSFPLYNGCCSKCNKFENKKCKKVKINLNENEYFEELSVFYVAFTRAKKMVYFTLSQKRKKYDGHDNDTLGSCFLKLKGIGHENLEKI